MQNAEIEQLIFDQNLPFETKALQMFAFQYEHLSVYHEFCNLLGKSPSNVNSLQQIPFLPIEQFKFHKLLHQSKNYETIFRSSGTTGQQPSEHFVADLRIYEQAILQGFTANYGKPSNFCILGLLPSYLERKDASLVYMVNFLMEQSAHKNNGFYLDNLEVLAKQLQSLQAQQQPTILFGVTFALLDFAEQFPTNLKDVIVIETGGMKGRRKEITRNVLHQRLQEAFEVEMIHSEYGMTELLSQAYFNTTGSFTPSSTLKVLARELNDPFAYVNAGKTGALNMIDLANCYSCSFIATQDVGEVFPNGDFTVLGRMDNADLRGCNLMIL